MARCEDFPCCGHEPGCCPDFDASGRQLNMKCVCGAVLPVNSRSSCCEGCLQDPDDPDQFLPDEDEFFDDEDDGQPSDLTEHEDFEQADEYFEHYDIESDF